MSETTTPTGSAQGTPWTVTAVVAVRWWMASPRADDVLCSGATAQWMGSPSA